MYYNNPKISIVIPVYNVEKYLSKCLDSVVNQTYKNLEIICINDGSTDNCLGVLQKYQKQDDRIIIIDKENTGLSDTRNVGTARATGEYLMYIDSDDWIDIDTCEVALENIIKEEADLVYWNYIREYGNKTRIKNISGDDRIVYYGESMNHLYRRLFGLYGKELSRPDNADTIVTAWGKLYRTEIIKESKAIFVDTRKIGTEDMLFNVYVFKYIKKAVYLPNYFNHYRKDNESALTRRFKENLWNQWNTLHRMVSEYLEENIEDDTFRIALNNRICMSVIGLGMNNLLNKSGFIVRYKMLKRMICSREYKEAFKTLDFKYLPFVWKIFLWLVKCRMTLLVYFMLLIIKMLRK
ncbi:MAG: glycosyltransferase family A protein [Clostridia bacterium]|nr:glycosyltransferase family A protein [Clostridia bacterium]